MKRYVGTPTEKEIDLYRRQQERIAHDNFLIFVKLAIIIYPFWVFIDQLSGNETFTFYLGLRLIILVPWIIIYFLVQQRIVKNLAFQTFLTLMIAGIGVSISSYFIEGLRTDYYNALILLSFLQFILMPTRLNYVTSIDIFYVLVYFPLNYFPFNIEKTLLIKQLVIYVNFAAIKYIFAKRSYGLIFESFHHYTHDKQLDQDKEISGLFGELCHLISNPLFISHASLKRALREDLPHRKDDYIEKSLQSHARMNEVVKKMQEFYKNNIQLRKYKDYFGNYSEPFDDDDDQEVELSPSSK